ncbi:hypothetical protein PR003_g24099 [Phytophthora rubi]|uniref:Uncharacterized protein n=1 Tax=Phytophthora rubi TaxID=129364 RepID=A0A6A3IUW0_9STRA|nr:hypothetical protein PR002_g23043 [Phytophthora rubi]KAE8988561.1 hypothetical protein PR001_g22010 [Phytophthora rubi]KAE9295123.1 hypothetical protein PR003_g24099 [Phytophthora rubi]
MTHQSPSLKSFRRWTRCPTRPERTKSKPLEPLDLPVTHPAALYNPGKGKKQHVSSSQIEIQLEQFHSQWLGTKLLPVGKQTVMQGLCPPRFVAKFSKMSGVQPWRRLGYLGHRPTCKPLEFRWQLSGLVAVTKSA